MIGHVAPSRPNYYDRNPATRGFQYSSGGLAPHAGTVRWTYTVPAGKILFLQTAMGRVMRATAAGTVGVAHVRIQTDTDNAASPFICHASIDTNVRGDKDSMVFSGAGILNAADLLYGITEDLSTTGTVGYSLSAQGVESDA